MDFMILGSARPVRKTRAPRLAMFVFLAAALASCSDDPAPAPSAGAAKAKAPSYAGKYPATLEEGVQFYKAGLPSFVEQLSGFSAQEPWGRWTDGPVAAVKLTKPLPEEFELVVVASAYGPNIGAPVQFESGGVTQSMTFSFELGKGSDTRRATFKLARPDDRIGIVIPKPTTPPPETGDGRALGIAFSSIAIVPKVK